MRKKEKPRLGVHDEGRTLSIPNSGDTKHHN